MEPGSLAMLFPISFAYNKHWIPMKTNTMGNFAVLFRFFFLFSILRTSTTLDAIQPSQSMTDGETLVSASGSFELGFFAPTNSRNRYVGLWYVKSPKTVVWVANREVPLSNKFGALNITNQGILVLLDSKSNVVWSSNTSRSAQHPVAQLLDSGNLVVRERNDYNLENFLWQSFDYPCDTQLPGMKVGFNFVTRLDRFLSSWKSAEDPARGEFSVHIDPHGYPQLLLKKDNRTQFRAGSWNGLYFSGAPNLRSDSDFTLEFAFQSNEVYFRYESKISVPSRHTLNPLGIPQRFHWSDQTQDWMTSGVSPIDQCENYALCGPNARCEVYSSPACACLNGYKPKSPRDWNLSVWSEGCIRSTPLDCSDKDGFLRSTGLKLPDTSSSWFDMSIGLKECKTSCLRNCSCTAYANLDIRGGGGGCLIWFGDLIDIRSMSTGDGQDLFVRMAASELGKIEKKRSIDKQKQEGIIASSVMMVIGLLILGIVFYTRKTNLRKSDNSEDRKEDVELPIYDLSTIAHATNNFSSSSKLGEGGFGPVYKGTLIDGQEIAVKRLSKSSGQGMNEFKNEVMLIAKLQHRNLVKLLGFCIHKDEQMLIYEFMPNKSLDSIIFDLTRSKLMDWGKRFHIIDGIARGLLYLHQDSRLRIIHRDIKASNILLDNELNPKISDFGLARIFGGDQAEANTNRVVGTYGYMSPEYALDGHFSVKSDVFSFGVLVLEIVSGKKNRGFCHPDQNINLLGHAWMLWTKGTPLDLIDECLTDSHNPVELLRCIHVALLCGQQRPEDRPNMSTVVVMLGSENPLPQPKQPGFFMGKNSREPDTSSNKQEAYSANQVTLTSLEAR